MKIVGYTVGTTLPKPNLAQTDPNKGDYVKGKEILDEKYIKVDEQELTDAQKAQVRMNVNAVSIEEAEALTDGVAYIDVEDNENVEVENSSIGDITIDSALSETSINPVQNKVVTAELNQLSEAIDNLGDNITAVKGEIKPPSVYYKGKLDILNDCQSTRGWTNPLGGAAPTLDTENYLFGTASIKSTAVIQRKIPTIDLTKYYLVIKIKVNSIEDGQFIRLFVSDTSSFTKYRSYALYQAHSASQFSVGEWVELSVPGELNNKVSYEQADLTNINYIRIRGYGAIDYNVQYVGLRKRVLNKGIVTFTFDDGWASQLTACKIMASRGVTGTLFIIPSGIGGNNYMTLEDCYSAKYDYGCDLQAHNSQIYTSCSTEELRTILGNTKEWFRTNALGDARHVAYPGGQNSPEVVKVVREFFDSARTISAKAESYPLSEPHRVAAVSSISSASGGKSVAEVKDFIDTCAQNKSWLILVFHRIEDVQSTMECSEADFTEILDYALSKDVDIKNYSEVFM